MSKSKKVVFFGTESFSLPSLHKLIASGYNVVAVVTKPDMRTGRGQHLTTPKVKQLAEKANAEAKKNKIKLNIKMLQPAHLSELKDTLEKLKPDVGILVAYGKIIPQNIIDLFPYGIINLHPSLLPKYRGPSPIEAAIINGDKYAGLSIMKLTAGMDEGPVYAQQQVEIWPEEHLDKLLFSSYLAEHGASLLLQKLPKILNGSLEPKPQDSSKATYTKLLTKREGFLNWEEPADLSYRKVIAYQDFPKVRAKIKDREVIITKARVAASKSDGRLVMKCKPGYLEVLELVAPSGRRMSGAAFLRGYDKN